MQVVDPIDDYLLDIDVFGRLTAENMRYGPVQRASGEPLILALNDNVPENMVQGEFGTCYLLSVLQCQSLMLSDFYPPQNIVQAYDMRVGVFACRFWHPEKSRPTPSLNLSGGDTRCGPPANP